MCSKHIHTKALLRAGIMVSVAVTAFLAASQSSYAASITFRYKHHLFSIDPAAYSDWNAGKEQWTYNGLPITPLPEWIDTGSGAVAQPPEGVAIQTVPGWNKEAIVQVIAEKITPSLHREPGKVTIKGGPDTGSGITFEGVGLPGRYIQEQALADLIIAAIESGVTDVTIPITEVQPDITVESAALREAGIQEVVTVGESNYAGSTIDRQHNIRTGLFKFNGHIIPQGSVFSFNTVLGPVDGSTGYRRELVIQGDRTVPEFGGGLCQVSTTAYRGIWEYGYPIEARRNHSYTVSYYAPQGTDATIYPGVQDMKFTNDSPSDLLIQTHMEGVNAYFIYYGTLDERKSEIIGPFTWGRTGIPAQRIEYTTDLPPGVQKKLGSPVPGMKTTWYRAVTPVNATGSTIEEYFSSYQARPLFLQIGAQASSAAASSAATTEPNPALVPEPSWLPQIEESAQSSSVEPQASTRLNRRAIQNGL